MTLLLNRGKSINESNQKGRKERRKKERWRGHKLQSAHHLFKAAELAQDKGSSSWLITLPLEEHSISLPKIEFRDTLSLRYSWLSYRMPSKCAFSENFTTDHALGCSRGAFPTIHHHKIRNLTGTLWLRFVMILVSNHHSYPSLVKWWTMPPQTNRMKQESTLLLETSGVLDKRHFSHVEGFNPYAKSNPCVKFALASCFSHYKKSKKRANEQRIVEVDHSPSSYLVLLKAQDNWFQLSTADWSCSWLKMSAALRHHNGVASMLSVIFSSTPTYPLHSWLPI